MKVCESCLEAAREESEGYRLSATMVAKTLGAEISDHLCVARDEGLKCGCACYSVRMIETMRVNRK